MNSVNKFFMFLIFFLVLIVFMGAVSAAEWNVGAGDSIQTVINNASENDTIIVNDNNGSAYVYNENVVIDKIQGC